MTRAARLACGLALSALALAAPCFAADWYVNNGTGNDATGTGAVGAPYATIAKAVSVASANDRVLIAASAQTYDAIQVGSEGNGPGQDHGGPANLTFIGDSLTPGNVKVLSIFIGKAGIVINGVRDSTSFSTSTGKQEFSYDRNISGAHIRNCVIVQGGNIQAGPFRLINSTIGADYSPCQFKINPTAIRTGEKSFADSTVIRGCTFYLRPSSAAQTDYLTQFSPAYPDDRINWLTFDNNKLTYTLPTGQDKEMKIAMFQRVTHGMFTDNKYTFLDSSGVYLSSGSQQGLIWRDGMRFNTFIRDTVIVTSLVAGTGQILTLLTDSGNTADSGHGVEDNNIWRWCVYKSDTPIERSIVFQYGLGEGDSVSHCTFVTASGRDMSAASIYIARGDAVFYRNTCAGFSPGAAFRFGEGNDWNSGSHLEVKGNIFYSPRSDTGTVGYATWMQQPTNHTDARIDSDYNMFIHFSGNNRDISAAIGLAPATLSAVGSLGPACTTYDLDCHSVHRSARFVDSTYAGFYNRPTGAVFGVLVNGEACGAYDTTQTLSDTARPDAVTDLVVTNITATSAKLTWTCKGDDGSTGTATSYDFRQASAADSAGVNTPGRMSGALFDVSEQVFAALPTPKVAGTVQSLSLIGLTPCTVYVIAMRSIDEMDNQSWVSNSVIFSTPSIEGDAHCADSP